MVSLWHWLLSVVGVTNPVSYNWWSGFFANLPMFGILGVVYKKLNCHAPGCHRIGLHRTSDGLYTLCRKHHPDVPNKLTLAHIHAAHRAHLGAPTLPES